MGIYVKGLAMPQGCEECRFSTDDCYGCRATLSVIERENDEDRPKWCPLIDVSGRGDLIDRDEAADDACLIWCRNSSGDDAAQEIIEHLRKMEAVIPAESEIDKWWERSETVNAERGEDGKYKI